LIDSIDIMSEEPPSKQQKTGWEDYSLNCNGLLMKADEGSHFSALVDAPLTKMEGIGSMSEDVLSGLGCETIKDLATYKFFLLARALVVLAGTEEAGKRDVSSAMNIDKAVDKEWEHKSLMEIAKAPLSALEGLTHKANESFKAMHIHTIADLADWKFAKRAEAIVEASKFEHTKTSQERKMEREMQKLN
jgi:predicted flap endonuclease-1-like 5' DNA nuclease